jgi:hypothetical protein
MKTLLFLTSLVMVAFGGTTRGALAQGAHPLILTTVTPVQSMNFNSTSRAITAQFTAQTDIVRVLCSQHCHVQIGISGSSLPAVATASGVTASKYVPANIETFMKVPRNGVLAVIAVSTAGTIYVEEMTR